MTIFAVTYRYSEDVATEHRSAAPARTGGDHAAAVVGAVSHRPVAVCTVDVAVLAALIVCL